MTDDFMVVARVESLILKQTQEDALKRAQAYVNAGADAIMIHSREKDPDEIYQFCASFRKFTNKVPLIVVPSSYNQVFESELERRGVNIVIYANHLLRSAYPAMMKTAISILKNERSLECDSELLSIKEALQLIPGTGE